jgi:hypothetical protein
LELANSNPERAARVNFMSPRTTDRQAFLSGICAKNARNPRQFALYCRQVLQYIAPHSYWYHNPLYFLPFLTLSHGTVILCTQTTGIRPVLSVFLGLVAFASGFPQKKYGLDGYSRATIRKLEIYGIRPCPPRFL